ncbi:MAG: hypothetical protein DRG20_05845 [Deltaproteobacteria bacterium]|nr:MAG: hypothetical protein DRG20_05845 [Deltaproteobacteria bacterium]
MSIFLQKEDGRFEDSFCYKVGKLPSSQVWGDFNSEDITILAISLPEEEKVLVLLGSGDGNFLKAGLYKVGETPRAITSGDSDNDKHAKDCKSYLNIGGNLIMLNRFSISGNSTSF